MLKKLLSSAFCIALSLMLITPAFAATPSVSVWYSLSYTAAYTPYDGTYYVYELSSSSDFNSNYRAAVSHAAGQWNPVLPISITQASVYAALNSIYGGTRSQLLETFPSIGPITTGITAVSTNGKPTSVKYKNVKKSVYQLQAGGKMAIVEMSDRTAANYKNTATHEMGHLFGWDGHSDGSTDVMSSNSSDRIALTTRDKTHLKQIYTLFYK